MNDIKILLDKYFAGETSREEDMQLRQYFSEANVDDEFYEIKPLFSYLIEEANVFEFLRGLRSESELKLEGDLNSERKLRSESDLTTEAGLKSQTGLRTESELKSISNLNPKCELKSKGDLKSEIKLRSERSVVVLPKFLKIATVAVCFLIGIFLLNQYNSRGREIDQNIVWIDGVESNDIYLVRAHAETSFSKVITDENIMEEQLTMMLK